MSYNPKCVSCGIKATKRCGCGNDYCDRHFQMHSHPKSDSGRGAGII